MSNTKAAALNRAFNNADATVAAQAATVADLAANEIAAANKFDDAALTDAALATKVMTNMGFLPSTVAAITQLEIELAAYFGGMGKGNRGYVVLQLSDILSTLTADATYGAIATAWNTEVAASVTSTVPSSSALTTASTDNLVGSSGDDTFNGVASLLSSAKTLNATDKIAGGAGNDTLNLDLNTAWTGFSTGSVAAVEAINLTNKTGSSIGFNATGISGATSYTVNGALAPITLTEVATGLTSLTLNNVGAVSTDTVSLAWVSTAAEVTGTANAFAINLNSVGAYDTAAATLLGSTVTVPYVETVTVNATGANAVNLSGSTAAKTITVTGAGSVTVVDLPDAALTSFDSSALTGATVVTVDSTGGLLKTLNTGSANDTINLTVQATTATATVNAGAGTDTVKLTAATGRTVEYTMSGVETLALTNVDADLVISGEKTTSELKTITIAKTTSAATTSTGSATFVSMGAKDLTFQTSGTTVIGNAISSDHTGSTTVNYTAGTTTTLVVPDGDFTFSKSAGALTVDVKAYNTLSSSLVTADKASSVSLIVTSGKDAAGTTEQTNYSSTISAPEATTLTINSTGRLGDSSTLSTGATITANKVTTATITNGTVAGKLVLTTDDLANLTVTTGSALDLEETATNLDELQVLTVAANAGLTDFGDLAAITSITASGTGTSSTNGSSLNFGNLGVTTNGYDFNLTATGLKGTTSVQGLYAGDVKVSDGYDININLAGVTGDVRLGAIGDTTAIADDVTITATSVGAFVVGAITADGDVTVNATGATSADLSTIVGDKVVVNLLDVAGSSDVGTVTATSSADLKLYQLGNNTNTINASGTSTALSVTLDGGIGNDAITVSGNSNTTLLASVVVTGDLGAATSDSIIVNAPGLAKTIDISGLKGYDSSTLTGGTGSDTIKGGEGSDTIYGGAGTNILSGGDGVDYFWFNDGQSLQATANTITDFENEDVIKYSGATIDLVAVLSGTNVSTTAAGIASFTGTATLYDTLQEKMDLLSALVGDITGDTTTGKGNAAFFAHEGTTYAFIESGTTSDLLIKLTGIALPTAATDNGTGAATGLSGSGA